MHIAQQVFPSVPPAYQSLIDWLMPCAPRDAGAGFGRLYGEVVMLIIPTLRPGDFAVAGAAAFTAGVAAPAGKKGMISTRILGRRTAPFSPVLISDRAPHGVTPRS